jgi:phage protein D/phage baseplate assembly protein gpV
MPTAAAQHVTPYTIKVDGAAIDPALLAQVTEVKVRQSLRQPASAAVRITDPALEQMDRHPLQIGSRLEIAVGAVDATSPTKIFDGEIVALEPEFEPGGAAIGVRAYDKSHRLQRAKKARTFQRMSATDMVNRIMRDAGLQGSGDATHHVFEFFQQSDETDREFVRRLERMHDFEFVVEDGQYKFRAAGKIESPAVTLEYGNSLLSFRPRLTAVQQDAEVEVRGWDIKGKQTISVTERSPDEPAQVGVQRASLKDTFGSNKLLVSDRSVNDTGEATQLAKATLQRRAAAFLEAEGTCMGTPRIKAGGKYVVTGVTHIIRSPDTYKTFFQISGRSDRNLLDLMHPPQERPWGHSMVVGIVTNNNDPEHMGRIRVRYPSLTDQEEGAWARVLSHNLGKDRGIFMLPQVDDEVVVAFESGDPRSPLVIGSVFNGNNKPGNEFLADQKGGIVVMSDDIARVHSKEDMTFKSDKKLMIEVTSDSDTKIKGSSKSKTDSSVEMKAGSSYTLEAGSSMTIKGASISVESQGSLKLKGATVEIESQGPATLKGAMIDINASGIANLKGSMVNIG